MSGTDCPEVGMHHKTGYEGLAEEMAKCPGMAIFTRFQELNVQNLLDLQADLLHLQHELKALNMARSMNLQNEQASLAEIEASQKTKIREIRSILKEYNQALLQQVKLLSLPRPRKYDYKVLQSWIFNPKLGAGFMDAVEAEPYEAMSNDLVALSGRWEFDILSAFLAERVIPVMLRKCRTIIKVIMPDVLQSERIVANDDYFLRTAKVISVALATLYPSIAIVALYFIPSIAARLGAILGFSFLFASSVAISTTASPIDIFAITVACASVQVVFVGSTSTLLSAH